MTVSVRVSGDGVAREEVFAEGVRLALSVASGPVVEIVADDLGDLFGLLGWPRPESAVRVLAVPRSSGIGAEVVTEWEPEQERECAVRFYLGCGSGWAAVDYHVRGLRVSYLSLRREVERLSVGGEAPDRYVFVIPEGSALRAVDAAHALDASEWLEVQDSGRRRRRIDAGLWAELCEPDAGAARPILERWARGALSRDEAVRGVFRVGSAAQAAESREDGAMVERDEDRSLYARAWVQGRMSMGAEDAADAFRAELWAQEAGAETFFTFAEETDEADYFGVVGHDMTDGAASYENLTGVWTWQCWGAPVEQGHALPEGLWLCGEVGTVGADDGPVAYLIAEQR